MVTRQNNLVKVIKKGVANGALFGIALWLFELTVISLKSRSILYPVSEATFIWQLFTLFLIYTCLCSLAGILLCCGWYVIQSYCFQKPAETKASVYSAAVGSGIFYFVSTLNVYYLWYHDVFNSSVYSKLGLLLIMGLLSSAIGYSLYRLQKKYEKSYDQRVEPDHKPFNKRKLTWAVIIPVVIIGLWMLHGSHNIEKTSAANDSTPSIILILVDTLRADHVSYKDKDNSITPNIGTLAKKSVVFTRAYSQAPWTRPSVATLLTGLYPSTHGTIRGSRMKGGPDKLSETALTLSEYARKAGYYTAGFTTNPIVSERFGFSQGYDEYHYLGKDLINQFSLFEWIARKLHLYLKNNTYTSAETLVDRTIGWLTDNQDKPFFLYLHFMDPHRPYFHTHEHLFNKTYSDYFPGGHLVERKQDLYRNDYKKEVRYVDRNIGRLMEHIKQMGLFDSALIVLTADHGEEFLEHGGWTHGHSLYEEQIRVPLLFKMPDTKSGKFDNRPVRLVDVFPTIVEILGKDIPDQLEGLPLIQIQGDPPVSPPYVFAERLPKEIGDQTVIINNIKLIRSRDSHEHDHLKFELYNIASDAEEKNDMSLKNDQLVQQLQHQIEDILKSSGTNAIKSEKISITKDIKEKLKTLGYIE